MHTPTHTYIYAHLICYGHGDDDGDDDDAESFQSRAMMAVYLDIGIEWWLVGGITQQCANYFNSAILPTDN